MKLELEEGKRYDLYAVDIATDSNGRDYIEAYDAYDNLFKIYNLRNCQRDELSKSIQCVVKRNPKTDALYLAQDNAFYYRKAYDIGHYYQFRVKDIVDEGEKKYYLIEDEVDVFYYPFFGDAEYQIGDDIILEVKEITDDGKVLFKKHQKLRANEPEQKVQTVIIEEEHKEDADFSAAIDAPVLELPDENSMLELKTSLVYTADGQCDVDKQTYKIIRVLASFMNTQGGTLYIGVHDKTHKVLGIEGDFERLNDNPDDNFTYKADVDGYQNLLRNRLSVLCQGVAQQLITVEFPEKQGVTYCKITVEKAHRPIWVNGNQLWVRDGNSTRQRRGDDISFFIAQFDIFERGGKTMTQEEMVEAMRNALNRDFAKTKIENKDEQVAYYITWYSDCSYQKTRQEVVGTEALFSLPVYKNVKDGGGVVLFCYDNGHVNKVALPLLMKGMNLDGKRKNRAFSTQANLLQIFITLPTNILAVLSVDEHGTQNAKAHLITDIGTTQGGGNQGAIFVPSPCTKLQYKLIDAVQKNNISHLIFPKNQTSQNAGFPVNSPTYKDELEKLLKL